MGRKSAPVRREPSAQSRVIVRERWEKAYLVFVVAVAIPAFLPSSFFEHLPGGYDFWMQVWLGALFLLVVITAVMFIFSRD